MWALALCLALQPVSSFKVGTVCYLLVISLASGTAHQTQALKCFVFVFFNSVK